MIPMGPNAIPINAWVVQSKDEADNILLHQGKLIILTEEVPDYLASPQYGSSCLMANCLLPNYEAVSYYLENDYQTFSRIYNEILMYHDNAIYFITMISAMLNNIPLGFVFGVEEIEQAATIDFLNFMAVMYGIHLGHYYDFANEPANNSGWMDRNFVPKNMSLLYLNNLLTPQEYLYVYPIDIRIDPQVLQKLVIELMPPIRNPMDMNEVEQYFNMFRSTLRQTNKIMVDPLVMQL